MTYELAIMKKKLLLHTCCAPCCCYVYELLSENYDTTLFFYNPNIYHEEEYLKRKNEFLQFVKEKNLNYLIEEEENEDRYLKWKYKIKGFEKEPEGGKRCFRCFEIRLEKTALYGEKNKFDIFTTTMSVSPHKNYMYLNEIGDRLSKKYNIAYLVSNFKKKNGFKKSCVLSKEYDFYRQNYCGCEFSIRKQ